MNQMAQTQHFQAQSHYQQTIDQRSDSRHGHLNLGAIMRTKLVRHAVVTILTCAMGVDSAYAACHEPPAYSSMATASIAEGSAILRYPQAVDNSSQLLKNMNKHLWITHTEQLVTLIWNKKQIKAFKHIIYIESRWNPNAYNPTTNAYGLGQLVDSKSYTKGMPFKQINAMAKYIYNRYGTPNKALAHHKKHGWY